MKRRSVSREVFKNLRCSICNSVSHSEIANELGEFNSKSFHLDNSGLGYLCHDCSSGIHDAVDDFEMDYDEEPDLEDLYDIED